MQPLAQSRGGIGGDEDNLIRANLIGADLIGKGLVRNGSSGRRRLGSGALGIRCFGTILGTDRSGATQVRRRPRPQATRTALREGRVGFPRRARHSLRVSLRLRLLLLLGLLLRLRRRRSTSRRASSRPDAIRRGGRAAVGWSTLHIHTRREGGRAPLGLWKGLWGLGARVNGHHRPRACQRVGLPHEPCPVCGRVSGGVGGGVCGGFGVGDRRACGRSTYRCSARGGGGDVARVGDGDVARGGGGGNARGGGGGNARGGGGGNAGGDGGGRMPQAVRQLGSVLQDCHELRQEIAPSYCGQSERASDRSLRWHATASARRRRLLGHHLLVLVLALVLVLVPSLEAHVAAALRRRLGRRAPCAHASTSRCHAKPAAGGQNHWVDHRVDHWDSCCRLRRGRGRGLCRGRCRRLAQRRLGHGRLGLGGQRRAARESASAGER